MTANAGGGRNLHGDGPKFSPPDAAAPPGAAAAAELAMLAADRVIAPRAPADFDVGGAVKLAELIEHDLQYGAPSFSLEPDGVVAEAHRSLVRDLDAAGYGTSLTELVQAVLREGPSDPAEARQTIRPWRAVLDPPARVPSRSGQRAHRS